MTSRLKRANWLRIAATFVLAVLASHEAKSQETDVMLTVRGHPLHFHILKGTGTPILFEAGGGDDATVWAGIVKPIHDITHATLITYDRAGFGRSELTPDNQAIDAHGIENGIEELEDALEQLGYNGDIVLVAHSYGALYATLYAARHRSQVKAAVFIDGSSACWFSDDWMKDFVHKQEGEDKPDARHLGNYYQSKNLPKTIDIVRAEPFPVSVPVIDLVSAHPPFSNQADVDRWRECHRRFVDASRNREGLTALDTSHYIYRDNPDLVVKVIVKAYADAADKQAALRILRRELDHSIEAANRAKPELDAKHP